MHVDFLKYAGKLNRHVQNAYTCILGHDISYEVNIGILNIFSFPYLEIHLLAALNMISMMGFHPFLPTPHWSDTPLIQHLISLTFH